MRLQFGELESFNSPDVVPNAIAQRFLAQLVGNEEFEFPGQERPRSVFITTVEFTGSRSGIAKGLLLSIDVGAFEAAAEAESDAAGTYDPQRLLRRYCIGLLELRLEPVANVSLVAKSL